MTPDLLENLEHTKQEILAAALGVTERQAATPPREGQWSIVQCLEHIIFTERRFLGLLQKADRLESPRSDPEQEAKLMARVTDRSMKANAPEIAQPKGNVSDLAEALREFEAAREGTIAFARENAADLDSLQVHHKRFGDLTGAQLLRVIAGHAARHAEQIREIRASVSSAAD